MAGYPVLGDDGVIRTLSREGSLGAILGVGDIILRRKLLERFNGEGLRWITAVHPGAVISESVVLGEGVAIMAGAVINCLTRVGNHSIVNTNASIDHDCNIGANVHVAPGVAVGGTCTVARDSLIGIGSRIIPGRSMGVSSMLGAGAVLLDDIPEQSVAVGVPARIIRRTRAR